MLNELNFDINCDIVTFMRQDLAFDDKSLFTRSRIVRVGSEVIYTGNAVIVRVGSVVIHAGHRVIVRVLSLIISTGGTFVRADSVVLLW